MNKFDTNLQGRLRNTPLASSRGLFPLFEAIVNSIHGIDEANLPSDKGQIRVLIERPPEQTLLPDGGNRTPARREISGFAISDNGIGFTKENFEAFLVLDTEHKVSKGGRGIGRLLWLKAFQKAAVTSRFRENGNIFTRTFEFTPTGVNGGEEAIEYPEQNAAPETTVRLVGYIDRYRENSRKTAEAIGNEIVEHCLWYFLRKGGAPHITIQDGTEATHLDDIVEREMPTSASRENVALKTAKFELLHIKLRAGLKANHAIAYCADNRLVLEENLAGKLPGLHRKLTDQNGEFAYVCYVSSPFLDLNVRPERSAFDLPDDVKGIFESSQIGWGEITDLVTQKAAKYLDECLEAAQKRAEERVKVFVRTKAPRYNPIIKRLTYKDLDPDLSDKEMELALHRQLAAFEQEFINEGHDLLGLISRESPEEYKKRLSGYFQKIEDIKKSDLANYVTHRRVVLDLLEAALKRDNNGNYSREDLIHALIMPLQRDSTEVLLDNCNLWLVDERLAFHDYLASDKPLASMPITSSSRTSEPDLVALNVIDNPILVSDSQTPPFASLVVIELKRPMRNDAGPGEDKDPVEQALGYLEKIRRGKVQTATGRPIPNPEQIPGFCYVICDITTRIVERCKLLELQRSADGMAYFGYKRSFEAYVEVISFDRLLIQAKERNRAFFDKLGLPSN